MRKKIVIGGLVALLVLPTVGSALATGEDVPLIEQEELIFAHNTIIPSPAQLISAMDKLEGADWSKAAQYSTKFDYANDYLRALNLGVRAADGFMAIKGKDANKLSQMSVVITKIANDLGVSEVVLNKKKNLDRLASNEKWDNITPVLDKLKVDIEKELNSMGDQDIATLISVGGWIEGLRAASQLLMVDYNDKASSILYQSTLAESYVAKLNAMDAKTKSNEVVKQIITNLDQIIVLMAVGFGNPVPKQNVEKLFTISDKLITDITEG